MKGQKTIVTRVLNPHSEAAETSSFQKHDEEVNKAIEDLANGGHPVISIEPREDPKFIRGYALITVIVYD